MLQAPLITPTRFFRGNATNPIERNQLLALAKTLIRQGQPGQAMGIGKG